MCKLTSVVYIFEGQRVKVGIYLLGLELDILMLRSAYYHLSQDEAQAVYWATHYIKLVISLSLSLSLPCMFLRSLTHAHTHNHEVRERAAEVDHFPAVHLPSFIIVADVLVNTGKWRLLKHLLAATRGWVSSYPITLLHAQRYQQLVVTGYQGNDGDEDDEDDEVKNEEKEEDTSVNSGAATFWASQVIESCWP